MPPGARTQAERTPYSEAGGRDVVAPVSQPRRANNLLASDACVSAGAGGQQQVAAGGGIYVDRPCSTPGRRLPEARGEDVGRQLIGAHSQRLRQSVRRDGMVLGELLGLLVAK